MAYRPIELRDAVRVTELYSFHYFQFATGYIFSGEAHDFWEMVYVDQGEADIGAGESVYRLHQGQAMFHQPNEWHSIWSNSAQAPNIFVVSFAARGEALNWLREKHFTLDLEQRGILSKLIREGTALFGPVLDISELEQLTPSGGAPMGAEQMVRLYLEALLISLLRQDRPEPALNRIESQSLTEDRRSIQIVEQLTELFKRNLDGALSFRDVCRALGLGETVLKRCARQQIGSGVMEYYQRLRIEEARRLLRKGMLNASQIASHLGYSSLQAFSRQFKHLMGITPSQYVRMVRG